MHAQKSFPRHKPGASDIRLLASRRPVELPHPFLCFLFQLAQLASKLESRSHSIRFLGAPLSRAVSHFLQKRISLIQWPKVKAGTNMASGRSAAVHGLSTKR